MSNLSNANAEFLGRDQNWIDELTVYWFTLTGTEYGTGWEFEKDLFGVVESGGDTTIVDCDGAPLTEGDHQTIAIRNLCVKSGEIDKDLINEIDGLGDETDHEGYLMGVSNAD